ncbi:YidC/Oxa1 family membrane protein insertase [Syntrophothermus lipocalidus]|uniref:Membrane protein insertase, YidC/Oxa1 family n=1 Tax=Syntrophothermus lipocalidus (strain DSM 12680 / TGB-C1) TaxID=643648 RepID=D7CKD4_SYNLT|nr:YidC/Oxa1 family membrane protein insertase [Syntrophothermus lipocalidus]ADI03118.1 membrane protein insertase, YidC/Oxa1 family [Syntrophothermus lipocalidus DSM 12680]HOV43250.1 YidC/Oxa1 family membrane protein insertase [Syntrophothermus lipocalidus]
MWSSIVQGFADLIQGFYHITVAIGLPNYGFAIILVTIAIKLLLYPLTHKQMKSMRKMQELQPRLKLLQERYKEDPQRMQKEVFDLYKEHGVSPLSGCLPLLIQLPILVAFYRALYQLKYTVPAHAAFLWVPTLSKPDPYYGFAILAGVTTYIQQKLSTLDPNDPSQKSMLYVMPVFIAWLAATLPAGLALYWVTFNVLSIAQQAWVNARSGGTKDSPDGRVERGKVVAAGGEGKKESVMSDEGGKDGDGERRKKGKKRG